MNFKSTAIPKPSKGADFTDVIDMTIPDQSMSLREILERFTRGEALPIGRDTNYHESEDDLEKVSRLDLVERQEFIEKQKETQKTFEKQKRKKEAAERAAIQKRIEDEERAKLAQKAAEEAAKAK